MATTANAYLGFNGKCREAMNFYKGCFGGELTLQTVEGSPMESQCPAAIRHHILHSTLTKGSLVIMGTDMVHKEHVHGNNISICVNCSSQDEIESFYAAVQAGGEVLDRLEERFWGAMFGVVVDKYGIRWMFNYEKKK
jgi:PhnB protein